MVLDTDKIKALEFYHVNQRHTPTAEKAPLADSRKPTQEVSLKPRDTKSNLFPV